MNPAFSFPLLRRFTEHFLALFYPEVCQMCREQRATFAQSYICETCRTGKTGIKWVEPPFCECCGLPFPGDITVTFECFNCRDQEVHFRTARSAAQFSGVVKEAIHRYKYNHASWFEPFLADLLITAAKPSLASADWDFIVPIPLHWRKMRQRTFNQSTRIAQHLSRATGIPMNTRLLKRVLPTSTQTRLTRAERAANVKRAFAFHGTEPLTNARIVLIDDVLTTGATASACAKLLRQNGAHAVDVWTVARNILK